jgi:hypothetical protein
MEKAPATVGEMTMVRGTSMSARKFGLPLRRLWLFAFRVPQSVSGTK